MGLKCTKFRHDVIISHEDVPFSMFVVNALRPDKKKISHFGMISCLLREEIFLYYLMVGGAQW